MPLIRNRADFAKYAAPEAVRAHLDVARRRAARANGEVRWLEQLLADKTDLSANAPTGLQEPGDPHA